MKLYFAYREVVFDMAKAYHSYFTKSISSSMNIQITIHPLSTDGAIVILVFFCFGEMPYKTAYSAIHLSNNSI